ncbi:GAS2-like protein pickled eggs [Phlebotomus argentipes]|uniref:GAS2-like protein pickled eggs n=1 Tax=Phlebotomus argentipes TaxID=94469 RepID=UPI002892B492|nr:GAS2-like protein pickled eggs [Phlebotomus argentipes]
MATVLLEARPYRPFKSSEEYLYAMREDLAEWLNTMYPELRINVDNFMDRLDTGVALCKHANNVRCAAEEYLARRQARNKSMTKSMTSGLAGPILAMGNVHFLPAAKSGTFFARDNVSNFIAWCRKSLQIFECLLFETDDLIMRKNEKHVILCLLEVARRGAKFGMLAPMLVQMERQIDREIAADNKAMGMSSVGCGTQTENGVNSISVGTDGNEMFDSDSEDEEENSGPMLMYGPQPQIITNDLKSLDEMVRDLVEKCTCPSQFPMVRVSEGKYRIGDTKVLIFVRILRSHVMVRVGGGWDTLSHYLDKHDPCRCRAQHRSSVAARLITRTNAATNGIELHRAQVFYERSPPVARKQANAGPGQQHTASNGFISTLSPPGGSHNRSRSPTPQKKSMVENSQSPEKSVVSPETRRSMSPGVRRLTDMRRKQNSLDSCQSPVGTASPIVELDDQKDDTKSGSVESNGGNSGTDSSVKFENISDNGSEISDEGYRSLGLIQGTNGGVSKRTSLHSQVSNEDAELSARFDQASNDSQVSPSEEPSTKTAESSDSAAAAPDELDARTPVTTPDGRNSFEKSGIFITEDEITVDIASATGLRKTGFSDNLYDDGQKKPVSRIPRSPMATRRKSAEASPEIVTGLPLVTRKTPVYRSVRKTTPVKENSVEKNTWSGRETKKRSSLTTETFTPPSRSASSTSPFHRNSAGSRVSGQYDKNGRRMKSTSLTTSPVKNSTTSPLAQQILQAAGSAKSDSQILEKMRKLLSKYERENSVTDEYESLDLTTAWVNSNGALDRAGCGPAKAASKKSAGSTISSSESASGVASPTPRRDRGMSRIPAPVRQATDLY